MSKYIKKLDNTNENNNFVQYGGGAILDKLILLINVLAPLFGLIIAGLWILWYFSPDTIGKWMMGLFIAELFLLIGTISVVTARGKGGKKDQQELIDKLPISSRVRNFLEFFGDYFLVPPIIFGLTMTMLMVPSFSIFTLITNPTVTHFGFLLVPFFIALLVIYLFVWKLYKKIHCKWRRLRTIVGKMFWDAVKLCIVFIPLFTMLLNSFGNAHGVDNSEGASVVQIVFAMIFIAIYICLQIVLLRLAPKIAKLENTVAHFVTKNASKLASLIGKVEKNELQVIQSSCDTSSTKHKPPSSTKHKPPSSTKHKKPGYRQYKKREGVSI